MTSSVVTMVGGELKIQGNCKEDDKMKQNEYVESICDRNHENCDSCPLYTPCHQAPAFSAGLEAHDMWQKEMNKLATRLVGLEVLLRAVYNSPNKEDRK